jgi:hypothetical protein
LSGLRVPPFLLALALAVVIVGIELGARLLPLPTPSPQAAVAALCQAPDPSVAAECATPQGQAALAQRLGAPGQARPGIAISYLALVDGLVLFILALMGASLVVPARVVGRVQGVVGTVVSLLLLLAGVGLALAAVGLLILMVSLLLAVPFGTLVYLILWGFFDRAGAAVVLSLLMLLKVALAACLAVAHQRFLQDRGLLLLVGASLLANVVVALLQGLVPGFLVSITDAIAAIVVAVIGIVMAALSLAGSAASVPRAVRPSG